MHAELRSLISDISKHNPAMAEAVTGIYNAIYEASELTMTADPSKAVQQGGTSKDAAEHVAEQIGENPFMTDDGEKITDLAARSGKDGSTLDDSDASKELDEISYNQAVSDFAKPETDPLALPSTEDLVPPEILPNNGGTKAPSEYKDNEEDEYISQESVAKMEPQFGEELAKDPLGKLSDEDLDFGVEE